MQWFRLCTLLFLAFYVTAENVAKDDENEANKSLSKRRPTNRTDKGEHVIPQCLVAYRYRIPIKVQLTRNFFTSTSWHKAMGWCTHRGSRLLIGDFNGDGKSDMLCHDSRGYKWIALVNARGVFTGTTWHNGRFRWCGHRGSQLLLGDFNGDGRTDMLCHDNRGRKWIAFATRSGTFAGRQWSKAMGWCWHRGSRLLIGDFNGDRRDDMLCHDNRHNYWVSFSQGWGFRGTSWHKRLGWCSHRGSLLHVADFNRDGRADLLCHDRAGSNWVMLASRSGQFNGHTNWHARGWCNYHGKLYLADFNGDKRADMLCHGRRNGYKWIQVAHPNIRRLFTGTTWQRNMRWCTGSGANLLVGDFNGDRKADMLCHSSRTGQKWIAFNHYNVHKGLEKRFRKINRGLVCFGARGNQPGTFRYYGPSRIVNGLMLVHRRGLVTCHYPNRHTWSRWGCGGHHLNVVVTDQYNSLIYPRKEYYVNRHQWYTLPGKHSKSSRSLFLSNVGAPFYLTGHMYMKVWYGEDLINYTEGDNRGRVCVDVYAWFA